MFLINLLKLIKKQLYFLIRDQILKIYFTFLKIVIVKNNQEKNYFFLIFILKINNN